MVPAGTTPGIESGTAYADLYRSRAAAAQWRGCSRSGALRVCARRLYFLGFSDHAAVAVVASAVGGLVDLSGRDFLRRAGDALCRRRRGRKIACHAADLVPDRTGGEHAAPFHS